MGSNKQYLDKNPNWLKIVEILRENPQITAAQVHKQFPQYATGTISGYMSTARKRISEERSVKIFPQPTAAAPQQKSRTIRRPAKVSAPVPATEVKAEVVVDSFESRLRWVKESTLARIAEAEKRRADLIDEIEALEESMRSLKKEVELVEVMATAPHSAEYLILELSC